MQQDPALHDDHETANTLSTGLGWFSIGLGLAELVAPQRFARLTGANAGLVQACGIREIACGLGILTSRGADRAPWMAARVAGDAMDMATVAAGRGNAGVLLALGGVAAADAYCAYVLSQQPSPRGEARRLTGGPTADDPEVEQVILIERPAHDIRKLLRDPEMLARIGGFHAVVEPDGMDRVRWAMPSLHGVIRPWTMRLDRDDEGSVIWRSEDGGALSVLAFHLTDTGRGTAVRLHARFDPPGGMLGRAAVSFFGPTVPKAFAMKALHFLKSLALTGEVPTIHGQPAARPDPR
ncbi:hypothetical protein [Falsirhodobacter deserti]|uniref:SRPBCC family protein n=1 Tax=Falsirhodobacter deserti TaxID=1365611 RepID=UPI000FE3352D|nr:hypothetical protein [Falsirhodobacter deserti]